MWWLLWITIVCWSLNESIKKIEINQADYATLITRIKCIHCIRSRNSINCWYELFVSFYNFHLNGFNSRKLCDAETEKTDPKNRLIIFGKLKNIFFSLGKWLGPWSDMSEVVVCCEVLFYGQLNIININKFLENFKAFSHQTELNWLNALQWKGLKSEYWLLAIDWIHPQAT